MSSAPSGEVASRVQVHVGRELKRLRRARGLTRADVSFYMGQTGRPMSEWTLGTYERGTRPITVPTLAVLCEVLGVGIGAFWSAVENTANPPPTRGDAVRVDVRLLVDVDPGRFAPLRRWAHTQHAQGRTVVSLPAPAVTTLAGLCGVDEPIVRAALVKAAPSRGA